MAITRPTSDITTTGWIASTGSALYDMVDETSPNDADYVSSPPIGSTNVLVYGISPLSSGVYNLNIRSKSTNNGSTQIRVSLLDASNVVLVSSSWQEITNAFVTYTFTLTFIGTATKVRVETQGASPLPDGQAWYNDLELSFNDSFISVI